MAAWSSVLSFGTHPVVGVIIPAHWHAVAVRPKTRVVITHGGRVLRPRVTGLEVKR